MCTEPNPLHMANQVHSCLIGELKCVYGGIKMATEFKDSVIAHMNATEVHICVDCEAAFVTDFSVSYTFEGHRYTKQSGDICALQKVCLGIPEGATGVNLTIRAEVFIATWKDIYTAMFDKPVRKCYRTSGTIFSPQCNEVVC